MAPRTKGTLADQLAAVLAYRNTPDHEPEPLQSNWSLVAANDNADPEETVDFGFERHLRMTPSVQEIIRQLDGEIIRGDVERKGKGVPIAKRGPIISIGKLHFSDGTQTEKAHSTGPDGDVVQIDRRMPRGAMLRTREKAEAPAGGKAFTDVDLANSNLFYAETFGTAPARFIKRTKRRNGPSLSAEQSRAMIAEAIANTRVMPPVTKCPTALPCGTERVADNFLAFAKVPSGLSGSVAWQDIFAAKEAARIWKAVRKSLRTNDASAIDAAMHAQSFEDIGVAVGQSPKYAKFNKGGKRALVAANDNLAASIKKLAG